MFKKIALLLALSFSVNGKEFSEQIIHIQPVSWDELQLLQLDSLKTAKELNLSETCPTELTGFEELEPESTYFKEILWTHYFWTVFKDKSGQKCLVKHDGFDFFSKKDTSSPVDIAETPEYEILNTQQARVLLSASESIGFDEKGIEVLKRHISKHNGAINNIPYKKYGDENTMIQFMKENKPDNPYDPSYRKKAEKENIPTFLALFESYYDEKTLKSLQNQVKSNPSNDKYNEKYPFDSLEALLEAVEHDLELYKAAKKTQHRDVKASSNLYKIENKGVSTL